MAQAIVYENPDVLSRTLRALSALPDLVPSHEIDLLGGLLQRAARGQMFVIQGGDCAEAFVDVQQPILKQKFTLLMEQARALANGSGVPLIPVGRIAGQYAKPRSSMHETLSCGPVVHAFRGENVNGLTVTDRLPRPERLCMGYQYAAATLAMLRADAISERWGLERRFFPSSGVYTSHEALHLPYECAMTRHGYNTSAHTVWIGGRSRHLEGAHVEHMRCIRNPVGLKVGPTGNPEEIVELLDVLNPGQMVGKVAIITRLGYKNVENKLPALVKAVQASGHSPVWMCDPCHGNTILTSCKTKTRVVEQKLEELKTTQRVLHECGSHLGGIHVEQTGEDVVTECVDSRDQLLEMDTFPSYRSLCDPRMSRGQARHLVEDYVGFYKTVAGSARDPRMTSKE